MGNSAQTIKTRLNLIDTLRGFSIISMIIYHTVWIMNSFGYGVSTTTLYGPLCTFWERTICMGFILISGFSFSLGKHHVKNSAITFGVGVVITAATCIFVPEIRIVFGVLTFLGSAGFIMIPVDKLIKSLTQSKEKQEKLIFGLLALLACVLFILFYDIRHCNIGLFGHTLLTMPDGLYHGYLMTYLGFLDKTFHSTDYFPLIPWLFLYFLGYFLEKLTRGTSLRERALTKGIPAISFLGRHSLLIYVIHPVVIFTAVYLYSIL